MSREIIILIVSFIISVIAGLIIIPILKKLKVRSNRKRRRAKVAFK